MPTLPRGPRFAPLQTYRFATRPFEWLDTWRATYGDVFLLPSLNGPVVMGTTPEAARQVFTADPDTFAPFGVAALAPLLGDGSLLVASGESHRRGRKLLTPPFHGARMRAYGEAMRDEVEAATARLRPGLELRAHDLTTTISLHVILRTIFGVGRGPERSEAVDLVEGALGGLHPALVFTRTFQRPWFPPYRRFLEGQRRYAAFVDARARAHREANDGAEHILGMLVDARHDDDSPLEDAEIQSHLLTLVIAGHETTSITLAWALHELLRAPAVLARLRAELDPLGPRPDPDAVARLPYLDAVVKETQRLRPVVTDVLRVLRMPMDFMDHRLEPGMTVAVAIGSIHRDPTLYPEPDVFRPERFLERKFGPFEHLPFGGGHRRCIGAAFSDHESKLVLAALVTGWDFEPVDATPDVPVRRNITMGPSRGVPVRVVGPRAPAA